MTNIALPRPLYDAAMDLVRQGDQENDWLVLHAGGMASKAIHHEPMVRTGDSINSTKVAPEDCPVVWSPSSGMALFYAACWSEGGSFMEPDSVVFRADRDLLEIASEFGEFCHKRRECARSDPVLVLRWSVMEPNECMAPDVTGIMDEDDMFSPGLSECEISFGEKRGVILRGFEYDKHDEGRLVSADIPLWLLSARPGDVLHDHEIQGTPLSRARHVGCSYAVMRACCEGDEDRLVKLVSDYLDAGLSLDGEVSFLRRWVDEEPPPSKILETTISRCLLERESRIMSPGL